MHGVSVEARPGQLLAHSGLGLLATARDGAVRGPRDGFFYADTRHLSRLELECGGAPVSFFAVGTAGPGRVLAYGHAAKSSGPHHRDLVFELAAGVDRGLTVDLMVANHSAAETITAPLALNLAADFADIADTLIEQVRQSGPVCARWDAGRLTFEYQHPTLARTTEVISESAAGCPEWDGSALRLTVSLGPQETCTWRLRVEPGPASSLPALAARVPAVPPAPELRCSDARLERAWATAVSDLASLPLGLEGGPLAPAAGVPHYQHFFGRDTLTTGWQALLAGPERLRDALRLNAAFQGRVVDDWRDEEPGKLLHQVRWGPVSELGIDALSRYYGDYATAPDFVAMLAQYHAWTNDARTVRELLPAARAALTWMDRFGDRDGDGFLEYDTRSPVGVKNQGWKDAPDSVVDELGRDVPNPIASSELQGYWFAGLQQLGFALLRLGLAGDGVEMLRKAASLRERFDPAFWLPEESCYALGLGPDKQPIRSPGSNDAHLLACGIVPRERARALVDRLMAADVFSGWGLRTLSTRHAGYHPFSYHRGSVWPVEQGTLALGLARYGCWPELHRVVEGVLAASDLFPENRLPEVLGGVARDADHPHPGVYPESCSPQAWSASAVLVLVQALLGLNPLAPEGVLLIDPHLPPWMDRLELDGVRVGRAVFDVRAWAEAGETRFRVGRRAGRVRVLRQPPPQDLAAGMVRRARLLARSLVPL